jgi:4-amino-4-deoxy-L-arabinose transferase-like glycosyltransferase
VEILERCSVLRDQREKSTSRKDEPGLNRFKPWHIILLILLIAFLLRIVLILEPEVIHSDGAEYIRHAKEVSAGNWMGGASGPVYPALISLASFFMKDYEVAGILVSVILGSLLVLPVFYLGKEIFNEKVGMLSALLSAVHPSLYGFSGSVLTESTYYFLLTTSVFFGWEAFKKGKVQSVFLFSLFSTLAFLTKPEGVGLILIFSVWILLINPSQGRRPWIKRMGIFILAIFCFLLFSSPYLIALKKELGKWGISKKASVTIEAFSKEGRGATVQREVEGVKINVESFFRNPIPLLGKVSLGFLTSLYKFQQAFHPILFVLAIFGWIGIFRNRSRSDVKGSFYLFTHHTFFLGCVLPFFGINKRYVSQMVAISLLWAAFGCFEIMGCASRWFKKEGSVKKVSFILLSLLLCGLFIQGSMRRFHDSRLIQKEAGLWMKEHLTRGTKIMSRMPQEAFYSELGWTRIPAKNYEEVLETARSLGVRYLVIDENIDELSSGFYEKIRDKDLVLLKELKEERQKIAIFEIIYPE